MSVPRHRDCWHFLQRFLDVARASDTCSCFVLHCLDQVLCRKSLRRQPLCNDLRQRHQDRRCRLPPPASPASPRRPPPTPPILFHSTDRPDPAQASTPGWSPCSVLAARLPPSPAGQSAHSPARPAAMGSSGPGCSRINVGCAPATGRAARPRPSRLSSPGRPARLRPWPRGRLASAPPTG